MIEFRDFTPATEKFGSEKFYFNKNITELIKFYWLSIFYLVELSAGA